MHINSMEKVMILKLMNGLYGISIEENAVKMQEFLSKTIQFFRYYTSEYKLVRMKEELNTVQSLTELMTACSGIGHDITINAADSELLNLYIPSNSLVRFILECFLYASDDEAANILMEVGQEEDTVLISIEKVVVSDMDRLRGMVNRLKESLKSMEGSSVHVVFISKKPVTAKIRIDLPAE